MDLAQDSTFMDALADLPDPRKRRGVRHAWRVVLTVISAALAAGCRTPHAIGQWVGQHAAVLHATLCPTAKPMPSEATIVRVASRECECLGSSYRPVWATRCDRRVGGQITCPNGERLEAQAIDGE